MSLREFLRVLAYLWSVDALAEYLLDHTIVIADPRKINAGKSSVESSNETYRRKTPNPPNKADITENAHRAGPEFNMPRPPGSPFGCI